MRDRMDIKIPAGSADSDTTNARSAVPPVEFIATAGAATNMLTVQDRQAVQDRSSTASYRLYFLPAAFIPPGASTTAFIRGAGRKVASLVGSIEAPGLGTNLSFSDPVNFGQPGHYFCVAVNRVGVEAPPENLSVAP